MRRLTLMCALFSACSPVPTAEGLADGELSTSRLLAEGTPEALGVLAFLNDRGTTTTLLDEAVGLDRRAAKNLVSHRDGRDARPGTSDDDRFDTVAELDAVAYVGDSALEDLLAYARDDGWIPEEEDFYGSIEGVTFTVAQADGVVELANTATQATLDDEVGLDARAAKAIVEARGFETLEQVAATPFIGRSALEKLRAWVDAHPKAVGFGTDAAEAALAAAVVDLRWRSESDEALEVFVIEDVDSISSSDAKAVFAAIYLPRPDEPTLEARDVQQWTIAQAFERYTDVADWWDPVYVDEAPKWQALRDIFEDRLTNATVFRFGTAYPPPSVNLGGVIDVYVVGFTADGDLVGFHTLSVET